MSARRCLSLFLVVAACGDDAATSDATSATDVGADATVATEVVDDASAPAETSVTTAVDSAVETSADVSEVETTPVEVPFVTATTIAPANGGACTLKSDGALACWGDNVGAVAARFTGTYAEISGTEDMTCVRTIPGALDCMTGTPPAGSYIRVAAGAFGGCAIDTEGALACWPRDASLAASPVVVDVPSVAVDAVDIAVGHDSACAVFVDGSARCWGTSATLASPPYRGVAIYAFNIIGVRLDGTLDTSSSSQAPPTDQGQRYTRVAIHQGTACGLLTGGGELACDAGAGTAPSGYFDQIVAAFGRTCVRAQGVAQCFGGGVGYNAAVPPSGPVRFVYFGQRLCVETASARWCAMSQDVLATQRPVDDSGWVSVSGRGSHACALDGGGVATCWGGNDYGQSTVPPGTYRQLDAAHTSTCAIKSDDTVACWGEDAAFTPPAGAFADVCVTSIGACARRADGSATCWGNDITSPASDQRFDQIACGSQSACGVRQDGTIGCWSIDAGALLTDIPSGQFVSLAMSGSAACGLRATGAVECWAGAAAPPFVHSFVSLALGAHSSCGLTSDARLRCWGTFVFDGL